MDILPLVGTAADRWLPILGDLALKGTLILLVALAVTELLRGASAAHRHLVLSATVVGLLAMPILALLVPAWRVPLPLGWLAPSFERVAAAAPESVVITVPPAERTLASGGGARPSAILIAGASGGGGSRERIVVEPTAVASASAAPMGAAPMGAAPMGAAPMVTIAEEPRGAGGEASLASWLLVIWLLGALAVLLRLAVGTIAVARLARTALPVEDPEWIVETQRLRGALGIRRPVSLLVTESRCVPVTWGVVYPVILLPATASEWDVERRRIVLLHELAHVRRLDAVGQVAMQLALALFWFNPLLWIAAARIRSERELACDDMVLSYGTRPSRYADDLLDIARTLHLTGGPAFATLSMARRSELEGRVLAILDPTRRREAPEPGMAFGTTLAMLSLLVPLAALRPVEVRAEEPGGAEIIVPGTATASGGTHFVTVAPETVHVGRRAPRPPAVSGVTTSTVSTTSSSCTLTASGVRRTHSTSGDHHGTWISSTADRCVMLRYDGEFEFNADESDVITRSRSGSLEFVELRRDDERRLEITWSDGSQRRRYTVNRREQDASAASAWLRSLVPVIARESDIGAKVRAALVLRERGVRGLLDEAEGATNGAVAGVMLRSAVQASARPDELTAAARLAMRKLTSDSDRSGLLRAVLERVPGNAAVQEEVAAAARGITSDSEKRRVLATLAATPTLRGLQALLEGGNTLTSDSERRQLLSAVRRVELDGVPALHHAELRLPFFASVDRITSASVHRAILQEVLQAEWVNGATLVAALRSSARIASDSEKATVLRTAAQRHPLREPEVRAAFEAAVRTITSETEARRVRAAEQG